MLPPSDERILGAMSLGMLVFVLGQLLVGDDPALEARFEREKRDPAWADAAEAAIRAGVAELHGPAGPVSERVSAELAAAEAEVRHAIEAATATEAATRDAFLAGTGPLAPYLAARGRLRDLQTRWVDLRHLTEAARHSRITLEAACKTTLCRVVVQGEAQPVMEVLQRRHEYFQEVRARLGPGPSLMWLARPRTKPATPRSR